MPFKHQHTAYLTIGSNERAIDITYTCEPGWAGDYTDPGYPAECTIERVEVEVLAKAPFGKPDVRTWEPAPRWMIDLISNDPDIHADMVDTAGVVTESRRRVA